MKRLDWRYATVLGILGLIFVGLTLFSSVVTQPSTSGKELFTNRSVFNYRPSGYSDWYAVMQRSGVHFGIWRNSFSDLDELPDDAVMLIIEPYTAASEEETFASAQVKQLLSWVHSGHTVILIDDFERTGSEALLHKLKLQLAWEKSVRHDDADMETDTDKPVFYHLYPLTDPKDPANTPVGRYVTKDILSEVPARFVAKSLYTSPVLQHGEMLLRGSGGDPAIATMAYGKGQLVLGTLTDLADNSFLQNKTADDNYQLLSNVVLQAAGGRPIYINEYVHGYSKIIDLLDYYAQKTPLGKVLTQLILVFMTMLWLSFSPWKPRARVTRASRQVPLSGFIESMAGIYYRGRAASLALSPRLDEIERTLRKRYRMGLNDTARVRGLLEGLLTGYSDKNNTANTPAALADALQKARQVVARRQTLPHAELLKLSQKLSLVQEALLYGNPQYHVVRSKN